MLVLKRYRGETITITTPQGDTITIGWKQLGPTSIALQFEAPRDIKIVRSELLDKPKPTSPPRGPRPNTQGPQ